MNVKGEDVDLEVGGIRIHRNKARDESQTVIIPDKLEQMLREQWPDGLPAGPIVNDVPTIETEVSRVFKQIARSAAVLGNGKDGGCTLHDLRRNYGSRWAGKVPSQVLQSLLRHANISTTLSFYADVKQAAKAAVRGAAEAAPNTAPNTHQNSLPCKSQGVANTA
jgi:integrase